MNETNPNLYCRILTVLLLASITSFLVAAPSPRIDPGGIHGSLILCGAGDVGEKTIEQFIALAHGKKARIVVVDVGPKGNETHRRQLRKRFGDENISRLSWFRLKDNNTDLKRLLPSLQSATGVWMLYDRKHKLSDEEFDKTIAGVLGRKGVVAAHGAGAEFIADVALPHALLDIPKKNHDAAKLRKALAQHRDRFGVHIQPGAALLVRGRRLFALTDTPVDIHLPASKNRPAKRIRLVRRKTAADLTALRRALRDRMGGDFPPKKPAPPVVEKGTLIIIGGGGMPKGLLQRMVQLAGGKKAEIVVLPTAIPDPIPKRSGIVRLFREAGAKKVTVLPQRQLKDVESKEFLDTLKTATGIWFGGGRQWRFVDAYENTKAHKLMFEVLKRGGVIAGSSAGASIQAEYLARGNPLGNRDIIAEGYERGLGFLKGVAIDQHFARRKRFRDMTQLIRAYPQLLGIGIDEATAITVRGSVAEVSGRGNVYFYDAKRKVKDGQPDYVAVPAGGRYDLRMRKILRGRAG